MKRSLSLALLINRTWMAFFIISSLNSQSVPGGDMLTETPLYPVPAEMTFEEYQDMNRRLTIGLALTSIPIPGIVHRYAGEKKKARRLFMIGAGGLGLMIAGASMMGEEKWPESDYNLMILNAGEDNEIRYEKIPINEEYLKKEDEIPNFEVDSIELADPQLFSDDEEINTTNHENKDEKESEAFESRDSEENSEIKEPEMFESTDLEDDLEIPAFLRRQKN